MRKIVSFVLYGNQNKYLFGMMENAKMMNIFYPEWELFVYVDEETFSKKEYIEELKSKFSCTTIIPVSNDSRNIRTWRFYALEESDIFISRDADSRFSMKELDAVNDWLQSDKSYHIMRDHPLHSDKILAGMWGYKGNGLKNIKQILDSHPEITNSNPVIDQVVLKDLIYPIAVNDSVIHASYNRYEHHCQYFPSRNVDLRHFVGQVFDEENNMQF